MDELRKTLQRGFPRRRGGHRQESLSGCAVRLALAGYSALLTCWRNTEQLGRTMKWDQDLEAKIDSLTPEQITAVFRKYIDPAQMSIVKAGDFKAAGVYQ